MTFFFLPKALLFGFMNLFPIDKIHLFTFFIKALIRLLLRTSKELYELIIITVSNDSDSHIQLYTLLSAAVPVLYFLKLIRSI